MNKQLIAIAILAVYFIIPGAMCSAQVRTPLTPEEKHLVEVQIEKERALTKYYSGQLDLARKQYQAEIASQPKSIWQKYEHKDPADIIETLAILIGGVMILITVLTTRRESVRNRMDTCLYEALSRFGDQSSPAVRMSAVGIIAQMGRRQEYLDTALDHLLCGLMLEEHPAVQAAIKNGIIGLAGGNSELVKARLRHADQALQEKVRTLLWDQASQKSGD